MEENVLKALLEEGITAAKAGQKERARQCLMQVVKADENNEQAWLWLSGVVESLEDKQVCLENVLAFNSDSGPAKKGLAWIAQQRAERGLSPSLAVPTPATSISPEPEPPPPPDFPPAPAPPTSAIPSTEGQPDQAIAPPAQSPPAPAPAPIPAVRYERRRKRESRSGALQWLSVGWGLYGLLSIVFGGLVLSASSLVPRMLEHPDLQAELREGQIL